MKPAKHDRWSVEFDGKLHRYSDLRDEVQFALSRALREIKIHNFTVRLKDKNSFIEKISRKSYKDPFGQMSDIVGARVVCLFLDDLDAIGEILADTFEIVGREDKTETAPPDQFSYRSVHYECRIKDKHSGPHYDGIKGLTFEVQVRTTLQDAWAVVEHTLAYKGGQSIPDDLKRDISALVGLFHLADKTFQQVRGSIAQSEIKATHSVSAAIQVAGESELPNIELNRSTVKALLHEIYPDREPNADIEYSRFVNDLAPFGVLDLGRLKSMLESSPEATESAAEEEAQLKPFYDSHTDTLHEKLSDVGFAKWVLDIILPGFKDFRISQIVETPEMGGS
ncbi:GTP pyrophosphokinase [Nocardia salmonicida]